MVTFDNYPISNPNQESLFIPDEDPTTTTNPLLSDTDKDGISDGD